MIITLVPQGPVADLGAMPYEAEVIYEDALITTP
jgi:hypothetical protein